MTTTLESRDALSRQGLARITIREWLAFALARGLGVMATSPSAPKARAVLLLFALGALLVAFAGCVHDYPNTPAKTSLTYPVTRTTNQLDDYHGTKVSDPYRWLEDPDSAETKAWVEAQNKVTFEYLGQINAREPIKRRLTQLWNYERYGIPFKEGNRYFITKNNRLQNQAVLYTMESLDAPMRELLDPNKLSTDGTIALTSYAISEDGNFMAYGLATAGSDWQEWKVRDVRTGEELSD